MPSRISIELSPSSATNSMTTLATPTSPAPVSAKKPILITTISNSPSGSAIMDNATLCHPTSSPSSSSSASFSSSSSSSSPSSSTLSLPAPTSFDANNDNEETRGFKGKGKALSKDHSTSNTGKGKGKTVAEDVYHVTGSEKEFEEESSASSYPSRSDIYTHTNARSSNSSSLGSLSSVEEEEDEYSSSSKSHSVITPASGNSKASTSPPSYSHATESASASGSSSGASSSTYPSYSNGASSSSGSTSGSGSCSKPALNRSSTCPTPHQRPLLPSTASSSAIPAVPSLPSACAEKDAITVDLNMYSYDAIPADFDFGDLPFYDTDPRTGIIYGDPHAITRPYLVPEMHFDLYRLIHDTADPRRTNFFNKHGALIYYHPGRHIGQEQDSIRSQFNNQAIWTLSGRTSTWGNLTASEPATKRQIKVVMESNKKKAGRDTNEPVARFVFRWKEDDYVFEYRKQKDQYRITCSQMCGGKSKWKPPQPKAMPNVFHGAGIDGPVSAPVASPLGVPSPFDATRYLQLISEYRLNSGPVLKRGDLELYNPDTLPVEFKGFIMLLSMAILDVMRPVDEKLFLKEFPDAKAKSKVPKTGGLSSSTSGAIVNGRVPQPVIIPDIKSASASTLSVDRSSTASATDLGLTTTLPISSTAPRKAATTANATPSANVKTVTPTPLKKSRWGSFFKK